MQTEMNAAELKQVFKQALIETFEEKTELFHDIIMEALEDIALSRAISEGEDTENVSKDEVFKILEGRSLLNYQAVKNSP